MTSTAHHNMVKEKLDQFRTKLESHPIIHKYGHLLEEKTKVNFEYFVLGIFTVLAICLFSGFGAGTISDLVGFVYPAYMTLVAIESDSKDDDTEWLMYWIIFASLFLVENFLPFVLYWIPFYYPLKVTFLIWCMIPEYQGAKLTYEMVLKPLYIRFNSANPVDAALNKADAKAAVDSTKEKST